MKKFYQLVILVVTVFISSAAYSQCSVSVNGTLQTLTVSGGSSSVQISMVHNPVNNVYYTLDGSYIRTHSGVNGSLLNSYYFSTLMRGIWWNPATNQLEGNGYNNSGIHIFTINSTSGYVTAGSAILPNSPQPYYQCQGTLDAANNEVLYFYASNIYRYSRVSGNLIGTTAISNMPTSYTLSGYSIMYTGCAGKEIALYDRANRKLLFINKATGVYVGASQLPVTAGTPSNWGVSFADEKLWVLSGTSWNSYSVMSFGLQTSAISGPFCDNSNVSVNFTLNTLTFNSGNIFTAQLSDASGNFSSPTTIGSVTSTTASTISGVIPTNTPAGSNYRIRVVSSNPIQTGGDNGTNIVVNVPNVNLGPDVSICPGDTAMLTAPLGVLSYNWSSGGTNQIEQVSTAGTYSVTVSNSVCSKSDTIVVSSLTGPVPTLPDTLSQCAVSTVLNPGSFSSYAWNTGATSSTLAVNSSGLYVVTVTGPNTCTAVDSTFANLIQPSISSGDTTICAGDSLELNSSVGCYFSLTNISTTNSFQVNAGSFTGDDRGGIAITPNYVYLTGDNSTVRYNTDLTSPLSLNRTDGIFSDLSSGKVYTLWGTQTFFNSNSITQIQELSATLTVTGNNIALSQTLNLGSGSYMFAGAGFLIVWSNAENRFYHIELPSGTVTDLGIYDMGPVYFSSENWAAWGVAECNGTGYSVVFRGNTNSTLGTSNSTLNRFDINTSTFSQASSFSGVALSDMATFTYSPWNSRWYFHSEGSNFAGNNSENLGYADAVHNGAGGSTSFNSYAWSTGSSNPQIVVSPNTTTSYSVTVSHGSTSCSDTIAVTVNSNPTISLSDTSNYCNADSVQISAPSGYTSYAWSTGSSSASTYVDALGYYSVSVTNTDGCSNTDSTFVNLLDARIDQVDTTLCSADSVVLDVNSTCGFQLQNITLNNLVSQPNQHGGHSGGIAMTPNYVYTNGTSFCSRFNLSLSTYTNLPVRDGIFSDLSSGQLYTFWSTTYNNFTSNNLYTGNINAIRKMDANLNYGTTIALSQSINCTSNSLVAAGTGFVILWSGNDQNFYKINLSTGNVEIVGNQSINSFFYFYNGWASYGIAECTDAGISLVVKASTNLGQGNFASLGRYDITTNTWTDAAPNSNVYSAMSDFTYSRWNNRWYFSHPSSRPTLGQYSPSIGYADATSTNSGGGNSGNVLWSNSDTTSSITVSPNTSTNYSVAVTSGSNVCRDTVAITVIQSPNVTLSSTNLTCFSDTNGTASLAVSGGTTPYSYAWSTGDTTNSVSSLSAGAYGYSVTSGNNCSIIDSVTITSPSEILVASNINNPASCYGSTDGSATVSVSGGTPGYTYLWPSGTTDSTDTQVAGGWNVITITDASGCVINDSINVTSPIAITNAGPITSTATFYCPGSTGTLVAANANVGIVNSNISLTSATKTPSPFFNSQMSFNFNSLPGGSTGNLTLTITYTGELNSSSRYFNVYDENNTYIGRTRFNYAQCTNSGSAILTVNSANLQNYLVDGNMTFSLTPIGYNSSFCALQASVNISYNYDSDITTYWFANKSSDTTQALGSGANLSVTPQVTTTYYAANFSNTCNSEFDSITVIVPPAPNTAYLQNPTSVCPGETVTVNAFGAITYTWPTGDITISGSGSTATVIPTGTTDYLVTITNAFNCSYVDTMNITVKPSPVGNVLTTTNVTCSSANDGQAIVFATGGQPAFTYGWSNGNTGPVQLGLAAGTYQVTITDAGSCTDTLDVTVGGPVPVIYNEVISNVTCNGLNDGAITLAPTGGTTPFTYAWSNGATTASVSNLAPGNYTLTITDNTSCSTDTTFAITEPTPLVVSITNTTPETCLGVGNGSITSSATGGSAPYTFNWDNGGTTAMLMSLNGGVYSLTVTDANGCTATTSATVTTIPSTLTSSIGSVSNVLCFNGTDGSAIASGSGGAAPYTYSWNNGANNASLTGVAAGTYTVTVTDNNSCQNINTVSISEPTVLGVSGVTFSNVTCNGLSNGSANIVATGGTAGYTYSWPDGTSSIANTNLAAGMFYVTVSDANSCIDSVQISVTEPTLLLMNPTVNNITCNGLVNGSVTTAVSGGSTPYTYAWSDGSSSSSITGLATGSYSLTVTDANNCQVNNSFTITQPMTIVASINTSNDVACMNDNTGGATASALGGTLPYTYTWSNTTSNSIASSLTAGTYEVTITDANGCFDSASVTISEPSTLLSIGITNSSSVLCNSLATGEATAVATGGGLPYTYTWSNGFADTTNSGLTAGTYGVSVLDNYGCEMTTSVTITEPNALALSVASSNNVDCFGADNGAATIQVTGGTAGYNYLWSNNVTTNSIANVGPGTYSLTVTDANNCMDTTSVVITEPTDLTASITNSQNVACNGSATGFAVVAGAGGTLPYSYTWDNGATGDSIFNQTSGFYKVTVTDGNGCIDSTLANLIQPSSLSASVVSSTNNLCFGDSIGSASVNVVGGSSPYVYAWPNGISASSATALLAGDHIVTITDANNCQDTTLVTILEPTDIVSTPITQIDPSCFGDQNGEVTVSVTGGVGSYSYLWSNTDTDTVLNSVGAGTYMFTVTDGNNCQDSISVTVVEPSDLISSVLASDALCNLDTNGQVATTVTGGVAPYNYLWSNGDTTATVINLAANTYMVTVSDANGCADTLTSVVAEPALMVNTLTSSVDPNCVDVATGVANTSTMGGSSPYTYAWTNGQIVESPTDLQVGTNVLTVTDANGCIDSTTVILSAISNLDLTLVSATDILCNGDATSTITVTAAGGSGTSVFSWSVAGTDSVLTNMGAGTYSAYVADNLGCVDTLDVVIAEPTLITGTMGTSMNPLCFGDSSGWAQVIPSGGVGNYSFLWPSGDTTDTDSLLSSNVTTVTISDSNNCASSFDVMLTDPQMLSNIGFNVTNISCYFDATGSVVVNPIGGTLPYNVTWSNGQTGNNAIALTGGTYIVQITDANGCILNDTAQITSVNPLTPSMLPSDTVYCGTSLTLTANTAFTSYTWSTGATTNMAQVTSTGAVWFNGVDVNGCNTLDTVDVSLFSIPVVALGADITNVCEGTPQSLDAGNFQSFVWSTGETTQVISVATSGTFTVAATDTNGCVGSDDINVTMWSLPVVDLGQDTIVCGDVLPLTYELDAGSGFTSYLWNTGGTAQTETISGNPGDVADYSVIVEDGNGCFGTDTINVEFTICSSVNEAGHSLSISLYPNPTKGDLNLDLKGYLGQTVEIEIMTTSGQVVKRRVLDSNNQTEMFTTIDLNDVSQGLYLVLIKTGGETKIERITIY